MRADYDPGLLLRAYTNAFPTASAETRSKEREARQLNGYALGSTRYYRLRSMVPRTREPEPHLPLPNPERIPDRLSRDPGSGGPRGQDWALVRVGAQDRIKEKRRNPHPHAQLRWT